MPVGLRDTDALIEKLASLGGEKKSALIKARGRYLDAMIDSHKYCALGRAAIFGEPDFCVFRYRFAAKTALFPFWPQLAPCARSCVPPSARKKCRNAPICSLWKRRPYWNDCDFDTIETLCASWASTSWSEAPTAGAPRTGWTLSLCAVPFRSRPGGRTAREADWLRGRLKSAGPDRQQPARKPGGALSAIKFTSAFSEKGPMPLQPKKRKNG